MFKRKRLSTAVAAAFLATSAQLAFAVDEAELAGTMGVNDSFGTAQQLVVDTSGKMIVQGAIGVTDPAQAAIPDVDFYSFEGRAGDPVTVDIDGGIKPVTTTTLRHVDTIVALFRPGAAGAWEVLLQNDNTPSIDEGSEPIGGERDARLDNPPVALPVDGTYIVAVSSAPRLFKNDGSTTSTAVSVALDPRARFPNGTYTLIISGVTPPLQVQYVNIDIKPGDPDEVTRLNPRSKRVIPIALLSNAATASSPAFNALEVKVDSITFGRGGEEKSLVHCLNPNYHHKHKHNHKHKHGKDANGDGIPDKLVRDVNRDGLPDLVCLFDISAGAFTEDDLVGKMKGESANGMRFEAAAKLKVKAPRKYRRHYHRDDD
jgi:hypothetical protein